MPDNTSVKQINPVSLSEVGGLLVGATVNCRVTADDDYSEGELYEHIDDVTTDSALGYSIFGYDGTYTTTRK